MRAKRVVRALGWVAAAAAVLLMTALFVGQTEWARERVRRVILSQANAQLNGRLEIASLTGSMLHGVTLHGVTLTQSEQPVFAADAVGVTYGLMDLLFGDIALGSVTLTRPTIVLRQDALGWNVATLGKPRPPTSDAARLFSIRDLTVVDGLVLIHPGNDVARELRGVQFQGALRSVASNLELRVDRLIATDAGTGVAVTSLSGVLKSAPDRLAFVGFRFQTAGSQVSGSLDVGWSQGAVTRIDASLTGDPISMPEVAKYAPSVSAITLQPHVDLQVAGPLNRLGVKWTVTSDAGATTGTATGDFSQAPWAVTGHAGLTALDLARFTGRAELASQLTASIDFTGRVPSGAMDRSSLDFGLRAPRVRLLGYEARSVAANGTYAAGNLNTSVSAAAYGAAVESTIVWREVDGSFSADGHLKGLDLRRLPAHLQVPALASDLAGAYSFATRDGVWHAAISMDASVIEGASFASGTVARLDASGDHLRYSSSGRVAALDIRRVAAIIAPQSDDPRWATQLAGDFDVSGEGSLRAIDDHVSRASLTLADSVLSIGGVSALSVRAALARKALTADVSADFHGWDPAKAGASMVGASSADGRAEAHVVIADISQPVSVESIDGALRLALTRSTVAGLDIDSALVDVTMRRGLAHVGALSVKGPDLNAKAAGELAFGSRGVSKFTYVLDGSNLAVIGRLFAFEASGTAHLEGELTGPRANAVATGTARAHQLKFLSNDILSVAGTYSVLAPDYDVARATIGGDLVGTFSQLAGFQLDRFAVKGKFDGGTLRLHARLEERKRTLDVDGSLLIHPDHREVHLNQLAVAVGATTWRKAGAQDARIAWAGDHLTIAPIVLERNDGSITVSGTLPLHGAGDSSQSVVVDVVRLPVADVNSILLGTQRLDGIVNLHATVSGSLDRPRVMMDGAVTNGAVESVPFDVLAIKATYRDRRATLDVRLSAPSSDLTVVGTIPFAADGDPGPDTAAGSMNLHVHATSIAVALFQPLTRHLTTLAGAAQMDLTLTGAARAPLIRGQLALADVAFRVAATGAEYRHAEARVKFDGDALTVERGHIEDAKGHVMTIDGGLSGFTGSAGSFELRATAQAFRVVGNEFGELSVSADLHASGKLQAPHIEGSIQVERGLFEVSELLERLTKSARPAVATDAGGASMAGAGGDVRAAPGSIYDRTTLAVALQMPGNVVLRGRDLRTSAGSVGLGDINLTMGGTLSLAKSEGDSARLLGRLDVVRGSYQFQGRRFEIARGSEVRFRGLTAIDPTLNITATRQISGVTAEVRVRGTASQPQITLSSQPPLDEADLLSLIVFNRAVNQLGESQRISLAERAATLAAGALATPISDSVARALDLDLFEIAPTTDSGGGPTVTIGRQISDRLFVGFRHEFGRDASSRVTFEYRLSELLRVVSSFGQGTQRSTRLPREEAAGLDVLFVFRR